MDISGFNYISLGKDCSPAIALRSLNLNNRTYPFDWIGSNFTGLCECIQNDFDQFHKLVHMGTQHKIVSDYYNFEYPHDYPYTNTQNYEIGDIANFAKSCRVNEGYQEHIYEVLEKYIRRIQRFRDTLRDKTKPLIFLHRGAYENAVTLKRILEKTYERKSLIVVVATDEDLTNINCADVYVVACNPEKNGTWNETEIWKQGINKAILLYNYFHPPTPEILSKKMPMYLS